MNALPTPCRSPRPTARLLVAVAIALGLALLVPPASPVGADHDPRPDRARTSESGETGETPPVGNTAAAAGGRAVVEIFARACPAGFDPRGATLEALNAACQEAMNGAAFSLTMHGSGQMAESGRRFEQRVGEQVQNGVRFLGILPGAIKVRGMIPPGYGAPIVFCRWSALGEISRVALVASQDGFDTSVEPNSLMSCAWINVPARGSVEAGTGNVSINTYGCPVGFAASNANLGQLASTCGETMNGIVFSLGRTLPGDWVVQATGSRLPSGISWTDVPAGRIVIAENIPTGYGKPIVYCQDAPEGQDGVLNLVEFNPSIEVVHELRAGYDLHCEWFNVPTNAGSENGVVEINKHVCPAGFHPEQADLARLATACQDEPRDGYLFTFYRNDAPQTEQRTGDRTPGAVHFGLGEAPAQFAVQEAVPDGFGTPVVYCRQTFANGGATRAQKMDVSVANAIAFGLNAGDRVFCDWFNVPEGEQPAARR